MIENDFDQAEYSSLFSEKFSSREELKLIANDAQFRLVEVKSPKIRYFFDDALNRLHYAKACQRVGRCMRLAVMMNNSWIGGIVLGSPFPNIFVRDEALGLRKFVNDYKARNLKNPWVRENFLYWKSLQTIVNHARAFIFPKYQGAGLGIKSQSLLFNQGVKLWEDKYNSKIYAFDNLCNKGDSKLFLYNGWTLVGETKGYSSSSEIVFSQRVKKEGITEVRNNSGLVKGKIQWQVWVKVVNPNIFEKTEIEYNQMQNNNQ